MCQFYKGKKKQKYHKTSRNQTNYLFSFNTRRSILFSIVCLQLGVLGIKHARIVYISLHFDIRTNHYSIYYGIWCKKGHFISFINTMHAKPKFDIVVAPSSLSLRLLYWKETRITTVRIKRTYVI